MVATFFQREIIPPDAISPSIRAVEPSWIVPTIVGDGILQSHSQKYVDRSAKGRNRYHGGLSVRVSVRVTDDLVRKFS